MARQWPIILMAAAAAGLAVVGVVAWPRGGHAPPGASGAFPQQAYVWQRAWTPAVKESVRDHAGAFDRLVVLGAEVSWQDGQPQVSAAEVDFALLKEAGCPVGLALRIGGYNGPFAQTGQPIAALADIAAGLVDQARRRGVTPAELQIDFDCPESKLDGYALWVQAIAGAVAPTPVTITALPTWLSQAGFKRLAAQVPQYVLQVHSLTRPASAEHLPPLCDSAAARAAVGKAAAVGTPFLVALPTYGYRVAFDGRGKYLGISAEGGERQWPGDAAVRVLEADADELAQLVGQWLRERPAAMRGVIWYRLPNADDRLNWAWPTLACVMTGTPPRAKLAVGVKRTEPALVDVVITNTGPGAFRGKLTAVVTCAGGKFIASDALAGFDCQLTEQQAEFHGQAEPGMLPPGGRLLIGWVRLSHDMEVKAHVATSVD
jgi:hypothetical protein